MKKNKKGFTLIELLAVIVILAVIALIAMPMVLSTIEKSKEGAASSSASSYVHGLETSLLSGMINGTTISKGLYTIDENGNITSPVTLEVSIKGDKATGGSVCVNSEGVVSAYSLKVGNYYVTSTDGTAQEITDELTEISCDSSNNNTLSSVCTTVNVKVEGLYSYGDEYLCDPGDGVQRTFYLLEDGDATTLTKGTNGTTGSREVSLIMNENIDLNETIAWITVDDYSKANIDETVCEWNACNDEGPVTAMNYLATKTSAWKNISVTMPTYYQIYQVTQKNYFSEDEWLWLYDNLKYVNSSTSTADGYWTTSTYDEVNNLQDFDGLGAFYVDYYGLSYDTVYTSSRAGVRPVITISK